jgi:hypothetical protein
MGDRGTKTEHFIKSVKAQRVDGSLYLIKKYIRFTLMGFEKSYHISNPSKQLNLNKKKIFSTLISESKINP